MRFSSLFCCGSGSHQEQPITNNRNTSASTAQEPALNSFIAGHDESQIEQVHKPLDSVILPISTPPVDKPSLPSLPSLPTPIVKPQSFSSSRSNELFKTYADPDDSNVIGPAGFEKLCNDAKIEMEGAKPLIMAWLLEAEEMAKFTRSEWDKGLKALQISALPQLALAVTDIENLLVLGKNPIKKTKGAEPYNRTQYWRYAESDLERKKAFSSLYLYCFNLAKQGQSRNIEAETACAFWTVLLAPQYPVISEVVGFINEKEAIKGVNKDLWNMMLEFVQTIRPNLDNYEADGAWPTLLDDFVAWKKGQ